MSRYKKRVAVGLSGGVDSSVAAALLIEKGYEVTGLTMAIYDGGIDISAPDRHGCYGPDEEGDIRAAADICRKLGIPFHVVDLKREYREHVIRYFKSEYLAGRTPNPCIVCNRMLKFGFLLEKARRTGMDFDFYATGHYARITEEKGRFLLKRSVDRAKDQTYFLYGLTPEQLSRTIFPLGELEKKEVRKLAASLGLASADRPESQDFIAGGDYSPLFEKDELKPGEIVDDDGHVLGRHEGIVHYTVGQRRGLGIAADRPLYVRKIEADTHRIVLSDQAKLYAEGLIAGNLNLIAIERLAGPMDIRVKIRLRHNAVPATLFPHDNDCARVLFEAPQRAVTPGQSAVFYQDDVVLGGGVIDDSLFFGVGPQEVF